MSDDPEQLAAWLERWFFSGDELAARRAFDVLTKALRAPGSVVRTLGEAVVDEVRQDVLAQLTARPDGELRGSTNAVGLARTVFRNSLIDELRKWGPRQARDGEVKTHVELLRHREPGRAAEDRVDAARAVEICAQLSIKRRLAVLLTTRPDCITTDDWRTIVVALPPPPPERPSVPLDIDAASRLLYPSSQSETDKERYQRVNTFTKTFKRAVADIRRALEVIA